MPDIAIALNRFGLGARPDEPMPGDAKAWLNGQFAAFVAQPAAIAALPKRAEVAGNLADYLEAQRLARQQKTQATPAINPPAMAETAGPIPGDKMTPL